MMKSLFLQSFLKSPLEIGSIIPSSKFMVNRLVYHVMKDEPKIIAEFGAGTGVITKELNHQCLGSSLIVFEKDETLREYLQTKFPHLLIYSEALSLPRVVNELEMEKVDCIVSGLPFALFSPKKTKHFLEIICSQLAPDGRFVMFQYSLQMRKQIVNLFNEVTIQFIPLNFPPAFIYSCKLKNQKKFK